MIQTQQIKYSTEQQLNNQQKPDIEQNQQNLKKQDTNILQTQTISENNNLTQQNVQPIQQTAQYQAIKLQDINIDRQKIIQKDENEIFGMIFKLPESQSKKNIIKLYKETEKASILPHNLNLECSEQLIARPLHKNAFLLRNSILEDLEKMNNLINRLISLKIGDRGIQEYNSSYESVKFDCGNIHTDYQPQENYLDLCVVYRKMVRNYEELNLINKKVQKAPASTCERCCTYCCLTACCCCGGIAIWILSWFGCYYYDKHNESAKKNFLNLEEQLKLMQIKLVELQIGELEQKYYCQNQGHITNDEDIKNITSQIKDQLQF